KDLKEVRRGRISEYAKKFRKATYHEGTSPWNVGVACDVAIPCATENEIDAKAAAKMVKAGVKMVIEAANMPTRLDAAEIFQSSGDLFAPSKAANAGGVAVSGLEQSQ